MDLFSIRIKPNSSIKSNYTILVDRTDLAQVLNMLDDKNNTDVVSFTVYSIRLQVIVDNPYTWFGFGHFPEWNKWKV